MKTVNLTNDEIKVIKAAICHYVSDMNLENKLSQPGWDGTQEQKAAMKIDKTIDELLEKIED